MPYIVYMILFTERVCYHTYKGCDIIERVGVMTQNSGCHVIYTGYDFVNFSGCDLNIHIPKGKLLLRCLWKDGLPLHSKTGN